MEIRQSIISSYLKCENILKLYLQGKQSEATDIMKAGTKMHNKMEKIIKSGEVPAGLDSIIDPENILISEKRYKAEIEGITISGQIDCLEMDLQNNPVKIIDFKNTQKDYSINYYIDNNIQGLIYSFLIFENFKKVKELEFVYFFPALKKYICFQFEKKEVKKAVKAIIKRIKNSINSGLFLPADNISQCERCIWRHCCDIVNDYDNNINAITKAENKKTEISKLMLNIPMNIDKIMTIRKQLEEAKKRIEIITDNIDNRIISALPDNSEYITYSNSRRTITDIKALINYLSEMGLDPWEVIENYCNISITKLEKDLDIPEDYIDIIPGNKKINLKGV